MTFIVSDPTSNSKKNNTDALEPLSSQACSSMERKPAEDKRLGFSTLEFKESENRKDTEDNVVQFKAHRVILAAQCTFFKCALLSGMKESIDRYVITWSSLPFFPCVQLVNWITKTQLNVVDSRAYKGTVGTHYPTIAWPQHSRHWILKVDFY